MSKQLTTLIERMSALALAAAVTLALLGGVDRLAGRDIAPDALLAQQSASSPAA